MITKYVIETEHLAPGSPFGGVERNYLYEGTSKPEFSFEADLNVIVATADDAHFIIGLQNLVVAHVGKSFLTDE